MCLSADMLAPVPRAPHTHTHVRAGCVCAAPLSRYKGYSPREFLLVVAYMHAPFLTSRMARRDTTNMLCVRVRICLYVASAWVACGFGTCLAAHASFLPLLLCAKRKVTEFLPCRLLEASTNTAIEKTLRDELEGSKKEVLLPLLVLVRSVLSYAMTLLGQKRD